MDVNAPYLPPEQPTDNPPAAPNRRGARTLVLWIVLVVLFVAIYQFLGAPPAHPTRHAPPPYDPFWARFGPWTGMVAVLFVVVLFLRHQLKGGARLNAKLEPGLLALADGDLGRAADVFAAVAREYRKQTTYAAVARLSLVTALMRQGELQQAVDVAVEIERTPGLVFGAEVRLMAAIELATLYAMRGQLDAASRWCEDARKRLARGQNRTVTAALLRLAEILVLARAGRGDEAQRALDRDERRLEAALPVTSMKKAWLLRAFVAAGQGARSPATPALALIRKGELGWMAVEWPELRAFLTAHDL